MKYFKFNKINKIYVSIIHIILNESLISQSHAGRITCYNISVRIYMHLRSDHNDLLFQLLQCQHLNFCNCQQQQKSLFQVPRSKYLTWTQPSTFTFVNRTEPQHECSGKPLFDPDLISTTSVIFFLILSVPHLCLSIISVYNHLWRGYPPIHISSFSDTIG